MSCSEKKKKIRRGSAFWGAGGHGGKSGRVKGDEKKGEFVWERRYPYEDENGMCGFR